MAPAKVTPAEFDRAMEDARGTATKFGTALYELDADRDRTTLEAERLRGCSAARWAEANDQIELLWICYHALIEALDAIQRRRDSSRRLVDLGPLLADLHGPLVELPSDAQAETRWHLDEAPALSSPAPVATVLSLMSNAFEKAAETITSLFAARDVVLPRLAELESRLQATEREAEAMHVSAPSGLEGLRARLADTRRELLEDPLSVDLTQIPTMDIEAKEVAAQLQGSAAAVAELSETLEGLDSGLRERKAAIEAARPILDEARRKIAQGLQEAPDYEAIEQLAISLEVEIRALRENGPPDPLPAIAMAEALANRLSVLGDATSAGVAAARRQLDLRRELRGRLDAYKAKAQALGRAEDAGLNQRFRSAHEVLYGAPCDLDEAARLVASYQMALSGADLEDRLS
jgi:hypothetical protein